jgi:hypothetical protein
LLIICLKIKLWLHNPRAGAFSGEIIVASTDAGTFSGEITVADHSASMFLTTKALASTGENNS